MTRRVAVAMAAVLVLGACSSGDEGIDDAGSVSVFGVWLGDEASAFAASMAPFEEESGIDVAYVGSANLEKDLVVRLDQGTRPDVAFVPQPGLVRRLAASGDLVAFDDELRALAESNYREESIDFARVDGDLYGMWWEADVKSLVWYRPDRFDDLGLSTPSTYAEMLTLTDEIAAGGVAPWCIGMADFSSTGWVATDWVEDIVLRQSGPEIYDAWVAHDLPFDSDEIADALALFGQIARQPERVLGSPSGWLTVPVAESLEPLISDPPGCLMNRQASFAESWFPAGTVIAPDGDVWFFPFPTVGERDTSAVIVGGQMAVLLNDTPEASQLLAYLADPRSGEPWAARGGYLSPHLGFDRAVYGSDFDRALFDLLDSAAVTRFDGSDDMVPAVGTGTFWSGMVDYVAGRPGPAVLAEIESTWPDVSQPRS